jgi:hypothetical protein
MRITDALFSAKVPLLFVSRQQRDKVVNSYTKSSIVAESAHYLASKDEATMSKEFLFFRLSDKGGECG